MDGYSDSAFRRICKEVNPNIVTVTEFTSADGLHFSADKLKRKLQFHPSEQPVIAQIFGKNVETFVTATKVCEDMGFSGIDLNMGCSAFIYACYIAYNISKNDETIDDIVIHTMDAYNLHRWPRIRSHMIIPGLV